MRILAFAASSSTKSVNKQLVTYAVGLLEGVEVEILDLNDYEMPLFSQDKEQELGQPQLAHDFLARIAACDALVISFAEHNRSYSAAYKNLFDWCSRINTKVFQSKPMVMLATSPGPRGATNVLTTAVGSAPSFGGEVKASLSVPKFFDNFDTANASIKNDQIKSALITAVKSLMPN